MAKVTLNKELDEFLISNYGELHERICNGEVWLLTAEIQEEYHRWLEE